MTGVTRQNIPGVISVCSNYIMTGVTRQNIPGVISVFQLYHDRSDEASVSAEAEVIPSEPVLPPPARRVGKKRPTPTSAAASGTTSYDPPAADAAASGPAPASPAPASPASALERLDILISGGADREASPATEESRPVRGGQRAAARRAAREAARSKALETSQAKPAATKVKTSTTSTGAFTIQGQYVCTDKPVYMGYLNILCVQINLSTWDT